MTTTTQTQEQPATTTCTPPSTQPRPRSPSLSCALHAGYDHVVGYHHRIYLPLLLLCFLSRTALLADTCCSCSPAASSHQLFLRGEIPAESVVALPSVLAPLSSSSLSRGLVRVAGSPRAPTATGAATHLLRSAYTGFLTNVDTIKNKFKYIFK
jgi:hypothetical protein